MGSNQFRVDIAGPARMCRYGRLKLDPLIAATVPLRRINEGFKTMKSGALRAGLWISAP
ncbi:MAG: hypothetical protein KF723_09680 [Rhizobiaceae bacterium]|nr:hypothetical protein [Rhizobiaceae bacterium]